MNEKLRGSHAIKQSEKPRKNGNAGFNIYFIFFFKHLPIKQPKVKTLY